MSLELSIHTETFIQARPKKSFRTTQPADSYVSVIAALKLGKFS